MMLHCSRFLHPCNNLRRRRPSCTHSLRAFTTICAEEEGASARSGNLTADLPFRLT